MGSVAQRRAPGGKDEESCFNSYCRRHFVRRSESRLRTNKLARYRVGERCAVGPAPPILPPGAQIAVLAGNPMQAVPYTIRLKFPAHYAIPAHSHPTDENVVVVSGALTFGMGDKLVRGAGQNKTLTEGGFALMPAGMNHYAFAATEETTIVLYGQGPVEFKYVNPADDPRNAHGSK